MSLRIVAVIGDYYHAVDVIAPALEASLSPLIEQAGGVLEVVDVADLATTLAREPDVVVMFKEDRLAPQTDDTRWMTPALDEAIVRYVERGGSWFAWHCGLASYPQTSGYIQMLRGWFLHHPKDHQVVQYQVVGDHALSTTLRDFSVTDEHYFVSCDESQTQVFLRSQSIDGESIAGWAHQYGRGRVCCFTPAHRADALSDPALQHAVRESVRWLAGL